MNDAIPFEQSLRVTIDFAKNENETVKAMVGDEGYYHELSSVCYWYQAPASPVSALPSLEDRQPAPDDNPAWPHLLGFIRGERATPGTDLSIDSDLFRQFMIEVTLGDSGLRESDVRWDDASDNVVVRGRYYNRGSRTIVWTGYFKEKGVVADLKEKARLLDMTDMLPGVRDVFGTAGSERPRLLQNLRRHAQLLNPVPLLPRPGTVLGWTGLSFEEAAGAGGEARFTVRLAGGEKAALACAVHPGRISFVKIEAGPAGGPRQPPRRGRGGPGDA